MSPVFAVASVAVESGLRMSSGGGRKVERPWAHNLLKILGSEVPRSTAVLCTDSLVARPRGTKIRREVVLIRVLNSLGGNKDY